MQNLIDIRRDESTLTNQSTMLNAIILFLLGITVYSYSVSFNPKCQQLTPFRLKLLTSGLVSSVISLSLINKLKKIEKKLDRIESDSETFEDNNRITLFASGNQKLAHDIESHLFPQKEEKDPFLDSMMQQIMNAPIKESVTESNRIVDDEPQPEILTNSGINYYNWSDCVEEAVGFIISGNSGSGKTSVACWLAGLLTKEKPAQVIALDPHYNDTWEQVGIKSLGKINEIESTLIWLLSELDNRCDRKSKKQNLGDELIVFCDEVNACLERFEDKKTVESAIKRLGSEGRKFGIIFIILNQSHNAGDLGISKKYLNNYFMIALGASARTIIHENYKQGTIEKDYINSVAYPCVVSGAVPINLALHPTHYSYNEFKKHGNPPQNLLPINQLPLRIGINQRIQTTTTTTTQWQNMPLTRDVFNQPQQQIVEELNNLYDIDYNPLPDNCPHCDSLNVIKHGSGRKKCNNCYKTFKTY
jgi:energy-coupling factor transporter ATP-binding protein EcfA2